jgi:hypothetical protein
MKRYTIFIAGERMGAVYAESPEDAVRHWIVREHFGNAQKVAESHHCRVTDIWAEEIGEKVYS